MMGPFEMQSQQVSPRPPAAAAVAAGIATLDRLAAGTSATVVAIDGDDLLSSRLLDHGLWPGAEVRLLGCAPLGDPLLFALHGLRLALRRDEAARVRVRSGGAAP
jgi:Fe2+ transport system protein FeoA